MNYILSMLCLAILSLGISYVLHWEVVTALVGTMCFCFFLYMWWDTELRQAGEP